MSRLVPWLLASGILFAACAFPDIQFNPEEDDEGTSSTTTTSMGGTGGVPVGGGGQGGTGGQPPICEIGAPGVCGPGMKCGWDPGIEAANCIIAGDHDVWTRCFLDTDCMEGLFCDGLTGVCHPFCTSSPQCTGTNAGCLSATNSMGQALPFTVCTSDCNPLSAVPCSDAEGKTTCYYNVDGAYWDCIQTSGLLHNTECNGVNECDRGLVCAGSGGNEPSRCREWCEPVGQACDAPGCSIIDPCACAGSNPAVEWGTITFGVCAQL